MDDLEKLEQKKIRDSVNVIRWVSYHSVCCVLIELNPWWTTELFACALLCAQYRCLNEPDSVTTLTRLFAFAVCTSHQRACFRELSSVCGSYSVIL